MREIKYQAFYKKDNKMYQVTEMVWGLRDFITNELSLTDIYLTNKNNVRILALIGDVILRQFTGLHDCKRTKEYPEGQEIYEGDIVKCNDKIGEVKYDEQQGAYIILWQSNNKKQKSGCDDLASTFPSPLKEVIGNIYESDIEELKCQKET